MAAIEIEKDSTGNIARRYGYLFQLPTASRAIIYASIPTIAIELLTRTILGASLERIFLYTIATEILLIFAIEIDELALRRISGIANFRRLSAVSILSNTIWFLVALVGFAVYLVTKSEGRFFSLVIVGAFFSVSFRALVFGSVFYRSPAQGLPLAFVQPAILILPVALSLKAVSLYSTNTIAALVGGFAGVLGIEIYLYVINKPRNVEGFKALQLFQAFLNAWTIEDSTEMERFFEVVSKDRQVNTTIIRINSNDANGGIIDNSALLLIVPGVHPGPFYPVGSSNLPGDIYDALRTKDTIPLIVHSISDHDLNLPTKSEVGKYLSSLKQTKMVDEGNTMTEPVVKTRNKATVSGFALGHTVVAAITQSPFGMEDLSVRIRDEIEAEASRMGFKSFFVIDTHNSLGAKPNEQESADIIESAKEVIAELTKSAQREFRTGFAHTSEVGSRFPNDIGPAGVGLVFFQVQDSPGFCFVVVDANNSKLGFREKAFELFSKESGLRILEICTSDTHVTAAKTTVTKGYLSLGDLISPEDFSSILVSLLEKARSRISSGSYSTMEVSSEVRTIGGGVLNNFSGLLDDTSLIAKRGAEALAVVAVLVTTLVAIA
ncbi:MAG: DUF2070 family protein [Thaumarchaeota archaeon]|nr:DUF2070 family protein [Nitrososphaerota archaeon]